MPILMPHAATHAALFEMWFPLAELSIPPSVKPEIAAIATQVSAGMLAAFTASPGLLGILTQMSYPSQLPFYQCLSKANNKAVAAFIAAKGGLDA